MTYGLSGFAIGVAAWWITGIDDFLIVLALMMKGCARSHRLSVSVGTLISVILMLLISLSVGYGVSATLHDYAYLFGIIPISLGTYGIIKQIKGKASAGKIRNDSTDNTVLARGLSSFILYLSNSSDDIILNSSLLQMESLSLWSADWWGFMIGILCGTISTLMLALLFISAGKSVKSKLQKNKKVNIVFSHKGYFIDCIIITIGILMLTGFFSMF